MNKAPTLGHPRNATRSASGGRFLDGDQTESHYRRLIEALRAAVYVCDANGYVTLHNDAAVALWGRKPEIGKDRWGGSWRIYRPDGTPLPLDECPMALALREGRPVSGEEIIIERPDGTRRAVEPHPVPLFHSDGTVAGAIDMLVDVTERARAEEGLARLAAIVDSCDDAIVGKTLDGIITSWNGAAERIFGYTAAEAIGRHISLIIPEERRGEEVAVLARLRRGERVDHFETERHTKDGRRISVALTVSPIRNAQGRIIGASKVARDITEQKQAEAALRDADRRKDEFLATLSHELRNPLHAILGWVRMLKSGRLDAATSQRAMDVVERSVDHQNRLIIDLLDVSRIVSGKLTLERSIVDLTGVVRSIIEAMRPSANASGVALTAYLPNGAIPIHGDNERLHQAVGNVLSNAVKFTPSDGRVTLRLDVIEDRARLSVSDTGPGIGRESLPHVFDRFWQADGTRTRAQGGLGLGLFIVKHIVELHGGSVAVESAGHGHGATFTIELPMAVPKKPTIATPAYATEVARTANTLDGVLILVVEDDLDSRDLIATILSQQGAVVMTAGSVREGLATARRRRPGLIVCDIGMPGDDGLAFIRELRSWPVDCGGAVPAVALTGFARPEDRDEILSAGFQHCLSKPAEPDALVQTIARLVQPLTGRQGLAWRESSDQASGFGVQQG
jgi:PAS domain S-box-containing protein